MGTLTTALGAVLALVPPGASAAGCELVQLATPEPGWGTVVDIEVVAGQVAGHDLGGGTTVYYGSYDARDDDGGTHQRSVIWLGLAGEPIDVGPGLDQDTAFELTASGLVNGASWDAAAGQERSWVRDLRTWQLTWVDAGAGRAGREQGIARRLNEHGALTGSTSHGQGLARAGRATAWDAPGAPRRLLPSEGRDAQAFGINDAGDRAGFVAKDHLRSDGRWTVFEPTLWRADGTVRTLAKAGIDAQPRTLDEGGRMSGSTWWGWDPQAGHVEAAYWPSADEVVGLGVLEDGAWSESFGMGDGGAVVGRMERFDDGPLSSPWGTVEHNFLWRLDVEGEGRVRVLPSLYSQGEGEWQSWFGTHAAHAAHVGLDQVGAGTHAGFDDDGMPVGAPTVFVNASTCGQLVATTHGAAQEEPLTAAQARAADQGR